MVNVYIWRPAGLKTILREGVLPDFGHVSLEVKDEATGATKTYASYWPELDSLVGVTTHAFKPREARNATSYEADVDPEGGYMQRQADFCVALEGLDEAKIQKEWSYLQNSEYDFREWNCSTLIKSLLLRAMSSEGYARVAPVADCHSDALADVTDGADLLSRVREHLISTVADCRPHNVLRVVAAYNGEDEEDIKAHQEEGKEKEPPIPLSTTLTGREGQDATPTSAVV